jgi:hypothetical protein
LLLRNSSTGALQVYNINNDQITGSASIGTVGVDWKFAGVAPVSAPGASVESDALNLSIASATNEMRALPGSAGVRLGGFMHPSHPLAACSAASHLSTHTAADTLNRRGIRTASGKQWHAMQVHRLRDRLGL